MLFASRNISISIPVAADLAYAFASDPAHLHDWASGLASGIRRDGDRWFAESPMGVVEISMTERNSLGVLDHRVTLPSGQAVFNGLRVMPNGDGCEFVFTVFKTPDLDDAGFDAACATVEKDLDTLKRVLSDAE